MLENLKGRVALLTALTGLLFVGGMGAASATPADPVADAFSDMNGKVTTYGAAIVALVVLSIGIFLGIKYLRKGVSKA